MCDSKQSVAILYFMAYTQIPESTRNYIVSVVPYLRHSVSKKVIHGCSTAKITLIFANGLIGLIFGN